MKAKTVIKVLLIVFISFMILFGILDIYKSVYKKVTKSDFAYLNGYTVYQVKEKNYQPKFSPDDKILLKKKESYNNGDVVLFKYFNVYILAKINDHYSNYYNGDDIANNTYLINENQIIGSIVCKYNFINAIRKLILSPISVVLIIILLILYMYFNLKKN